MEKQILYVNACVRKESGTRSLGKKLLARLYMPYEEIRLEDISFPAVTEEYLNTRDQLLSQEAFQDPLFGFPLYRSDSDKVIVFEAPIDLLSYMSLYPDDRSNLIALGCLSPKGLYRFLSQHQHIDTVFFLLDNDGVGPEAAYAATDMLLTHGYKVEEHELACAMTRHIDIRERDNDLFVF